MRVAKRPNKMTPKILKSIHIEVEPLFEDELNQQGRTQKRLQSVRGGAYMKEDKMLCEAKMEIGQRSNLWCREKRRSILEEGL